RFLLRLAARGFGALAGAPLLFLGAAHGFFCRALAILYLANLRVLERPAAGLHFLGRQLVEHDAAGRRNGRSGTRCLGRGRGSGLRLRNVGARLEDARHLRALVRPRELPLLGLDDDGLRPSVRKALAHGALLHAGALQRQRLLGADAQGLVVTGLRIAHSVSSAAFSIVRAAATRLRSSELVPRYLSSAATRFSAALPASPASRAACITFVAPNAKPNSDSEKSLCAGISGPPAYATARRACAILRTPSSDASWAWSTASALPLRTAASTFDAPSATCPALRARPSAPRAVRASRRSTVAPRSGGTVTSFFRARAKSFFVAAWSTYRRSAVTQQPRPGSLRPMSGTTVRSGPATKRSRASGSAACRVTIHVRSFMSSFKTRSGCQ